MTTETLPQLVGTEKQVAWATQIRAKYLAEIDQLFARIAQQSGQSMESAEAQASPVMQAYHRLTAQSAATWWIDHRQDEPRQLLQSLSR